MAFGVALRDILLVGTSLSCSMVYTKITLSFPPEAYTVLLSLAILSPYQDFGISLLSTTSFLATLNN